MKKQHRTRRILSAVAAVCCAITPFSASAQTTNPWGDVNCDGKVTVEDAQTTLRFYTTVVLAGNDAFYEGFNTDLADVDGDGKVSVEDAQWILKKYVNGIAGITYLLPVEEAEQKELTEARVLCRNEDGWFVWSEPSNSVSAHIVDIVREGELFQILEKNTDWYTVKLQNGKNGYMSINKEEFDKNFVVYTPVTEPASTTTAAPVTTTAAPVTTTKAPVTTTAAPVTTTKAAVTTTAAPVTTTKAPVTTTAAPVTTTAAPVTTTAAPVTTTSAPATTTAVPVTTTVAPATTTTAQATTTTTVATTTTEAVTTTTAVTTTATPVEPPEVVTTPKTGTFYDDLPMEKFQAGDIIAFQLTCWKVYDAPDMKNVIAWSPNETYFAVKRVVKEYEDDAQILEVYYLKGGERRLGYIYNGREGYFKLTGHLRPEEMT